MAAAAGETSMINDNHLALLDPRVANACVRVVRPGLCDVSADVTARAAAASVAIDRFLSLLCSRNRLAVTRCRELRWASQGR